MSQISQYNNYFDGRVVIITGCYSAIGQSICEQFSQLSAKLVCVDIDSGNLLKFIDKLVSLSPKKYCPLAIVADLTIDRDIHSVVGQTVERFGRIDILVNNAGFCSGAGSETPSAIDCFDRTMAINVRAKFHLSNLVYKWLALTKGAIVNISGINNIKISSDVCTAYNISVAAMDQMTRSLATEWSPSGVRVNSVNLGHVLTPKLDDSLPQLLLEKLYPIGRFGRPIDITNAVLFLASDLANFITGVNMQIDGGYRNLDALSGAIIARQHMTTDNWTKI